MTSRPLSAHSPSVRNPPFILLVVAATLVVVAGFEAPAEAAGDGPVAGATLRDCPEVCPEMTIVPAGSFVMGSPKGEKDRVGDEGPQRTVQIARPLLVSTYEVTFEQWDACAAAGGCARHRRPGDNGWGRGTRPAINISYADAQDYLAWLSDTTGHHYRLLSEAEWEYAARGGTTTRFSWGDDAGAGHANCDGCGSRWDNAMTAPVGSFAPNGYGLHDMLGNTWEWTEDCWVPHYKEAPVDGSAKSSGRCTRRAVRGGAWNDDPAYLRSAARNWQPASARLKDNGGLRIARDP